MASDIRDVYQPGQTNSLLQSAANIGTELYNGVYDEVAHHKDTLLISAGSGLGVGFAVGPAATPAVATGLMVLGLGYSGYQIYKHLPGWIRDAKVTANPQMYSRTEVEKAHQGVEGFGTGALDLGVGMIAGIAGGYAGRTVKFRLTWQHSSLTQTAIRCSLALMAILSSKLHRAEPKSLPTLTVNCCI